MKKFEKVIREGKHKNIKIGDHIVVSEKVDGTNASIEASGDIVLKGISFSENDQPKFEIENLQFNVYSHNSQLSQDNTLRGFYGEANEKFIPLLKEYLKRQNWAYYSSEGDNYKVNGYQLIIHGEWLVPHSVQYKEEAYKKFYPFAVYSKFTFDDGTILEGYNDFYSVEKFASVLRTKTPEVFYEGPFNGINNLLKYVGKSDLSLEKNHGEGIVIFNEDSNNPEVHFTKIVSEEFSEKKGHHSKKVYDLSLSEAWIEQYATEGRINKIINKFIDEGKMPEIKFENFGKIASPLSQQVYDDILEEEKDNLPDLYDEKIARKLVNRKVPPVLRSFIEKTLYLEGIDDPS